MTLDTLKKQLSLTLPGADFVMQSGQERKSPCGLMTKAERGGVVNIRVGSFPSCKLTGSTRRTGRRARPLPERRAMPRRGGREEGSCC